MIELFFKSYVELINSMDFVLIDFILKSHGQNQEDLELLVEMLSVLAILMRNNVKFEASIKNNKSFIGFVRGITGENNQRMSDELVEVLAHFPLEDLLLLK